MFKHADKNESASSPMIAVFITILFVGLFTASAVAIMTIQPAEPVNDARVSYANDADGSMEVEAYMAHNVDYILVQTADGETAKLYDEGDKATVDANSEDVEVYKVVNGNHDHIQTLEYHTPPVHTEGGNGVGVTIEGTIEG